MDARQKAFDRFFAEWQKANEPAIGNEVFARRDCLTKAAYAAGWNAALDWVAKQIQGETE